MIATEFTPNLSQCYRRISALHWQARRHRRRGQHALAVQLAERADRLQQWLLQQPAPH